MKATSIRLAAIVIVTILLVALQFGAYAKTDPPSTPPAPTKTSKPESTAQASKPAATEQPQAALHIGSGRGGPSGAIGTGLATLLNKYTKIDTSVESGQGMTVYPLMNSGELDLVAYSLPMPMRAYTGQGVERTRLRDLGAGVDPSITVVCLVTRPDTGIKTVKELRGKKVSYQTPQPYEISMLQGLVNANGMTLKDFVLIGAGTTEESVASLIEKRVEAIAIIVGTFTQEIKQAVGIYFIPFSPEEQAAIKQIEACYNPYTAAKGFRGLETAVPLVAAPFHIVVRAGMNDITAYTIVKTLYDHIGEFHQTNPTNTGFHLKSAASDQVLPMHPGAIRYFKENGVWTAENEANQQKLLTKEKAIFGDK